MRLVLVRVDEMHGGFARHRAADHGHRLFADGLVHVVLAVVAAMDRPFQADRNHRPGTDLAVAVGIGRLRHQRLFLDHGVLVLVDNRMLIGDCGFGLGFPDGEGGLGVLENARDGRQRLVGRVDF